MLSQRSDIVGRTIEEKSEQEQITLVSLSDSRTDQLARSVERADLIWTNLKPQNCILEARLNAVPSSVGALSGNSVATC
jgi:hypothetical protein